MIISTNDNSEGLFGAKDCMTGKSLITKIERKIRNIKRLFSRSMNRNKYHFDIYLMLILFTPLGFAGTPGYLSPEVLKKEPYGKPVDIWACGK